MKKYLIGGLLIGGVFYAFSRMKKKKTINKKIEEVVDKVDNTPDFIKNEPEMMSRCQNVVADLMNKYQFPTNASREKFRKRKMAECVYTALNEEPSYSKKINDLIVKPIKMLTAEERKMAAEERKLKEIKFQEFF